MALKFKSFAQPDLLKRIQLENLIRLLEPHRLFFEMRDFSVPDSPEKEIDYLPLAAILAQPDEEMSSELVEALHIIGTFSGDENFDVLLDLAQHHRLVVEAEATAPDLATRLYLRDPEILERKQRERLFETRKTFECYRAADPNAVMPTGNLPADLGPLESDLGGFCLSGCFSRPLAGVYSEREDR